MSSLRERIETRLRERIEAAEESDGRRAGRLDLGPLFTRLDDVILVVEGIRDYSVAPYHEKVREIVCATCRQDGAGRCATRDQQHCGLDKYFPMIVAVIEEEFKSDPGLP